MYIVKKKKNGDKIFIALTSCSLPFSCKDGAAAGSSVFGEYSNNKLKC